MSKVIAIGTAGGKRQTGAWGTIHSAASKASLAVVYAMMGLAGVLLWVMVHLPVGARARESLAYAMVGCVGLFTLGWQMMRAQLAGQRRI
ncbi:MAG: hypothetical protein WC809_08315 [Sinimarinibacterium sp.]|jgi:hypothetical protein